MRHARLVTDELGSAAVELALTAPAFVALLAGVFGCGLLMWTMLGLQHGVEMAARCASIDTTVCSTTSAIQTFAADNAYGLNPPASTFTVSTPSCGTEVTATYPFPYFNSFFGTINIAAQACFPK
jgi:Flp pilus assembly protein TadG